MEMHSEIETIREKNNKDGEKKMHPKTTIKKGNVALHHCVYTNDIA